MGLDDRLGDKEAQSRAPKVHRPLVEETGELVEELGDVLMADPDSLVVDRDLGIALLVREGDHREIAAARRVFDRVDQQVEQGLLQPPAISPDDEPRLHPYPHRVTVGIGPEMSYHILDEVGQLESVGMVSELV